MAEENTVSSTSEAPHDVFTELTPALEPSRLERLARRLVLGRLEGIEVGRLEILERERRWLLGRPTGPSALFGRIVVTDPAFWERLAWGGSIGAGEAFCDGLWETPDLTAVVRVLARNQEILSRVDGGTARLTAPLRRLLHALRSNTESGSIRNIAAHYDAGNHLFAQFLDPTLSYSCAIFPEGTSSLETAQEWKLDTVCRKLELRSEDRLLEIGTGWGGLAIHAARHYGCEVVTTTISEQQFRYASDAVARAGLAERVTVLRADYRNLPAILDRPFDKLVSIEMIEAVGHAFHPRYFEVVSDLLTDDGLALIQAILIPDQRYETYRRSVDFIQRYVFPGSLLPSLARIQDCTARHTDLRLVDLEDLTPHYARTLAEWDRRFAERDDAIADLGLSEAERRKWRFYFAYCEGGFLERTVADVQLLYAKPGNRRQPATAHASWEAPR